jgi:mono/diheme cytochrome c family protein
MMTQRIACSVCFVLFPALLACGADVAKVSFNQDVRPILSNHCFACHGPDESKRDSGLRLDDKEGLASVLTPGDAEASELIRRVVSEDEYEVMPPPEHNKPLSKAQRETLVAWVAGGAEFTSPWAFTPPQRPELPPLADNAAVRSPIDQLVQRRIEAAGLTANPRADRRSLIRRVTFDLTGLPPTPAEVDAFLADDADDAYEQLVDRLLESPRYGEHMGRYWLDLVRYGDTHGLHLDNYREMWPYRDWVIRAFNENKPFDQFIVEQLAGDLLPEATLQQKIASGFNRLNVTTSEGGSIYDEVFFRNVVDRVDAFGTVFLGMTTGCAVCHDHKFDPLTTKDYYSLYAFFNSLDGRALDGNKKDHPPVVRVPQPSDQESLAEIDQMLAALQEEMTGPIPSVDKSQRVWEQQISQTQDPQWQVLQPEQFTLQQDSPLKLALRDDQSVEATGTAPPTETVTIEADLPPGDDWRLLRLEALTDDPKQAVGLSSNGNAVLSEIEVETKSAATDDQWLPVDLVYGEADYEQPDGKFNVSYAIDGEVAKDAGWAIGGHLQSGARTAWFAAKGRLGQGEDARVRVRLKYASQWAQHIFSRVRLSVSDRRPEPAEAKRVALGPWQWTGPFPVEGSEPAYDRDFASLQQDFDPEASFAYREQSYAWQEEAAWSEAQAHSLPVPEGTDEPSVVVLHRRLTAPGPQTVQLLLGTDDGVQVYLNNKRVGEVRQSRPLTPLQQRFDLALQAGVNDLYLKVVNHGGESAFAAAFASPSIATPATIRELAQLDPTQRSADQQQPLRDYYRRVVSTDPDWTAIQDQRAGLESQRDKIKEAMPVSLVWKELDEPRQAQVMKRGQYDQPGEEVSRRVPGFLPPLPEGAPRDRLGLAQWLVDPQHPLTARVAVNRFWQQLFGTGIVATSEDFGAQGEVPSHPDLLDWLAVDFRENRWDVKRLMKQLVLSETYRRDATVKPEMLEKDPRNRLLARGPRFRLDAEMLRDQALFLSGLLVEKVGGPSVKPPQPSGLWKAVGYTDSNTANFKVDEGEKIYRRSVYTFWKRTSPPPQMTLFDAPSRESCTARRERTNTPLQALVLMNEAQYVEAAKTLGEQALAEGESSVEQRLQALFERVTMRPASDQETAALLALWNDSQTMYANDMEAAQRLTGQADPASAAWTVVASVLLNLDEVQNK